MPKPEAERLEALLDYGIMDTEREEAFDRLTALAAEMFDAPIALVSLVDAERQWFKSRVGLDAESTPRNLAFCGHAIQEEGENSVFVVEDATKDARFSDNPLVTGDPDIRFYAGAVLTNRQGYNLGTLCIIDRKPRHISDAELSRLKALARIVVDEMELARTTREAQRSRARYQLLAEHMADAVARIRLDGSSSYISPAIERLIGLKPREMAGQPAQAFVHPADRPIILAAFAEMTQGVDQKTVQVRAQHKDGHLIWVETSFRLIRDADGVPVEMVAVIRDISDRKAMELELEKSRAEAQAASAAKSEFLANMSHELRTPLTAVIGFSGLLRIRPDVGPESRPLVDRIEVASRSLLATINDVLDFSKLEAGQVEIRPTPVNAADLVREVCSVLDEQARKKSLTLDLQPDPDLPAALMLDRERVSQVLMNLMGNAVKFTDAGTITVTSRYDAEQRELVVCVRDTGPGLTADQRALLFQRFSQVDGSTTRKHGGTGLGLAICKGLVEAMGGEIGVDSTPGEGSDFWFALPAKPVDKPALV